MVHVEERKVMQTLGQYAHGQRVRLVSNTAPFRIRLPGGPQRNTGCAWCCCDPVTGDPVDSDELSLHSFVVRRSAPNLEVSTAAVSEFVIRPLHAIPVGQTFTFRFRYVCSQTGVRLSGRDSRYRVTVFYASV